MRADTWGDVLTSFVEAGGALVSRLHALWPGERARRAAFDEKNRAALREVLDRIRADSEWTPESDDAEHVSVWMAENGFAQRSDAWGLNEQTEAAITAATDAFRLRIAEILGHDEFDFEFQLGLDHAEGDE